MNANLLKGKIVAKGMTQADLSKKTNIRPNTLSAKLNGHSLFDTMEVVRICEALGITDDKEKVAIFLK